MHFLEVWHMYSKQEEMDLLALLSDYSLKILKPQRNKVILNAH